MTSAQRRRWSLRNFPDVSSAGSRYSEGDNCIGEKGSARTYTPQKESGQGSIRAAFSHERNQRMKVDDLHPWAVGAEEARQIQDELRRRVVPGDALGLPDIHVVAGVDNGYVRHDAGETAYAALVTLSFPALEVLDTTYGTAPVTFPYMPGLLTFREAPAILGAFRRVNLEPEVVLFDGQGIAHYRGLGLASHLGVILNRPTIGCAKSRLVGRYEEPGEEFGDWAPLVYHGQEVGAAVRTKPGHSPLFVSPGTLLSIPTAVAIVLACCRVGQFLPEPTRLAHQRVTVYTRAQREMIRGGRE